MMCSREIDLKDMLSDPIVQAVMRADGIDRDEFDALLASIARVRGTAGQAAQERADLRVD